MYRERCGQSWYGSQTHRHRLNENSVTESLESDSRFARDAWLRALGKTANIGDQGVTLPALMQRLGGEFGAAPALISSDVSMRYRQLAFRCNQYARWGIAQGLVSGDAVSLLMGNCAEYLGVWLGLTQLGVVVALINSQLVGEVLAHSINIARPRALIVGADLAPRVAAIRKNLPAGLTCRVLGSSTQNFAALEPELAALSGEPLRGAEGAPATIDATALYIYTSGTTGLPKAAKVSHYRLMQWSHWFAGMMDTRPEDRMFNCLPLYHSVGGVVAIFAPLVGGGAVVIRPRFSASDFWRDVRDERCTLFQYIGELCRYLVNSPPQAHRDRTFIAAGVRQWLASGSMGFVQDPLPDSANTRVLRVHRRQFFAVQLRGPARRHRPHSAISRHRLPVALLRFDVDTGEPRRNQAGYLRECARPMKLARRSGSFPRGGAARRPIRRLCGRGRLGAQSTAQCLQGRRFVVPHRRPDAAR